jgi:hypothetical protein
MVTYVGEWHSHPPFCAASPSTDDRTLLKTLADTLGDDGDPALMLIVGSAGDLTIEVQHSVERGKSGGLDAIVEAVAT